MEDGLLVELSRKGKGGSMVKKGERETAGLGEKASIFRSGPEGEPGKSCCCPPLFRL
jgi:hypothetical protein